MTVKDVYNFINSFAPFSSQAAWDNSGLLLGAEDRPVSRCLVCLDVTHAELKFALENGCELIVSHHPVIFRPVKSVCASSVLWGLIKNDICVISAHTNLDKAPGGVNDALCDAIGMTYGKTGEDVADGFLNVGTLPSSLAPAAFAAQLGKTLGGAVRYIDGGSPVEKIAVCSGAGGSLAAAAAALGCTALVTGDADHHDFLDAAALGISLFAAGHYETERLIAPRLRDRLAANFGDAAFFCPPSQNPITVIAE